MSTYPINVFVFSDGTWIDADQTDQAHSSNEKYRRIRTARGRLCVSAGMWDGSQLKFKPFQDAVEEARCNCLNAEHYDHRVMPPREPLMNAEHWREWVRERSGHQIGSKGLHALRMVVVEGFDYTGAARVAGMVKPETNGRVQVKRLYRAFKKQMADMIPPGGEEK